MNSIFKVQHMIEEIKQLNEDIHEKLLLWPYLNNINISLFVWESVDKMNQQKTLIYHIFPDVSPEWNFSKNLPKIQILYIS